MCAAYSRQSPAGGPALNPAAPRPAQEQLADRLEWVSQMRALFSPAGVQNADGTINQEFFKPKQIVIQTGAPRCLDFAEWR